MIDRMSDDRRWTHLSVDPTFYAPSPTTVHIHVDPIGKHRSVLLLETSQEIQRRPLSFNAVQTDIDPELDGEIHLHL